MPYVFVLVVLALLDGVWLKITSASFYKVQLAHVFADRFTLWPAVLFYPVYAFAVYLLVVAPALKQGTSLGAVFFSGMVLGLAAYGAYDFTNQATLKNWPVVVTIVDLAWGATVTALVSVIVVGTVRYLHS